MADPITTAAIAVADPWGAVKLIASIASPVIAAIAMCISACIARTAIKTPQRDRESDHAMLPLQRARGALTNDERAERAEPDRLNWLTAARDIKMYKKLKQGVTEPSQRRPLMVPGQA